MWLENNAIAAVLKYAIFWGKGPKKAPHVQKIYSKRSTALTAEKQKKLEEYCEKLFEQQALITSGKLQFMGLSQVKRRMGKSWPGLQVIVYETAEAVMSEYMEQYDTFVRYQDDIYVMIFAKASYDEGVKKATMIAEEVRQRLFDLGREELKDIDIRHDVKEIHTALLRGKEIKTIIAEIAQEKIIAPSSIAQTVPEPAPKVPFNIRAIEVGTAIIPSGPVAIAEDKIQTVLYSYAPLWDVTAKALTTYLCLPREINGPKDPFIAYSALYSGFIHSSSVAQDMASLDEVRGQLDLMERNGRKLYVICPVQHETLYRQESLAKFIVSCQSIPVEQRKYLVFLITNMSGHLPIKDPYSFVPLLKKYCRYVFATVSVNEANFIALKFSELDAIGVVLEPDKSSEHDIIKSLNRFQTKAKSAKIGKTFVLGVSSLSLTTSAVCAGYDYLGGGAIHENVGKPDNILRYQFEDLISSLIPVKN